MAIQQKRSTPPMPPLALRTLRDRDTPFEPQLVKKNQTRITSRLCPWFMGKIILPQTKRARGYRIPLGKPP